MSKEGTARPKSPAHKRPAHSKRAAVKPKKTDSGVKIPVRVTPGALNAAEPAQEAPLAKESTKRQARLEKRHAKRSAKHAETTRQKRQHAIAYARRVRTAKHRGKRPPTKYKPKTEGTVPEPVRRTTVAALILLVILVTAGVLYTYFAPSSTPESRRAALAPTQNNMPSPIVPSVPRRDAPESAAVEMLDSPVKPGGQTSVSVRTLAGSRCNISVKYNQIVAKASGLVPKTADIYGNVSWNWSVDPSAPAGSWPVKVTCSHAKKSAVVIANLEVSFK